MNGPDARPVRTAAGIVALLAVAAYAVLLLPVAWGIARPLPAGEGPQAPVLSSSADPGNPALGRISWTVGVGLPRSSGVVAGDRVGVDALGHPVWRQSPGSSSIRLLDVGSDPAFLVPGVLALAFGLVLALRYAAAFGSTRSEGAR